MEVQGVVSPLIAFFDAKGLIKPFAGIEGAKAKAVTLQWPAGTQNNEALYFYSDSSLDGENAIITEIEVVDQATQNLANTYPAKDNLNNTQLAGGWLVLSNNNRDEIAMIPLNSLIRRLNGGKPTFFNVQDQVWQNCYVMFSDATILTTSNALTLRVCYIDKNLVE
jgi:hypothetical protein